MKRIYTFLIIFLIIAPFQILPQFTGNYYVGNAGTRPGGGDPDYATLKAACDALNAGTITGNCTFYITSSLTEAQNVGLAVNTNGFSIAFKPSDNTDKVITFTQTADNTSPSGHFVIGAKNLTSAWSDINIIATSNVVVDGYADGSTTRRLKLTNQNANVIGARLITIVGDCDNVIIKNSILENMTTNTTSPSAIAAIVRKEELTATEHSPDNLLVENNLLTTNNSVVGMGMRITNRNTISSAKATGFIFRNNIVTAQRRLLEINYVNGATINNNEFSQDQKGAPGTVSYGVWTNAAVIGTVSIFNNQFIKSATEETGAFGHRVISLSSGATYNVYNNVFMGMNKSKVSSAALNLYYLFYSGVSGTIYNNTFYMPNLTDASHSGGAYRAIQLSGNTAEIVNNIFISDELNHTSTSFIHTVPTPNSDYNVFYIRQANPNARIVSTYATLNDYRIANPTKDINSVSKDVNFISATDLHLTGASLGDNDLIGTVLGSVTTDIDGHTRNAYYPYKGADENTATVLPRTNFTVPMTGGISNAAAFGSTGKVGSDGAGVDFYAHWDATYLYLGWTGGKTNYSSDLYYAAIDTDPDGTNGSTNAIEGVSFQTGAAKPDYYLVFENNSAFYGVPVTDGNAIEFYNVSGGAWNWVSRTGGNDNTASRVSFTDANGEVRLRIPWTSLGSITPGAGQKLGITMWNNNVTANYMWARLPNENPANGATPKVLSHQMLFNSTASGLSPVAAWSSGLLPVELSSLNAAVSGTSVTLKWTTATEVNSYQFQIEQRSLGTEWSTVSSVQASGNSNSPKKYQYTVESLTSGKYQFRLKMIDADGSFEYSEPIAVEVSVPMEFALSQNYPNPFNPTTTLNYALPFQGNVQLLVYSINGELVKTLVSEVQAAGSYSVSFDASQLASGTYIYRLIATDATGKNFTDTKKMLLMK